MRKILIVFIALSLFSFSAFASYNGPVFSKTVSSGFVPTEHANALKCDIYRDHVVITRSVGPLSAKEKREINLEKDPTSMVAKALKVPTSTFGGGHPDDSTTTYTGFLNNPNGSVTEVILKQTGPQIITRDSEEARLLINFINVICGN